MSMARCDECERLIDTDDDPEAIQEWPPGVFRTRCKWCRDDEDEY